MNLSLVVPQLFYDVIARVMPGWLFLFITNQGLKRSMPELGDFLAIENHNSVATAILGLQYIVICYFLGWILRAIRCPNLEQKVWEKFSKEYNLTRQRFATIYYTIRLNIPEEGFRLVKLRAEARLLEASRCALCLSTIITVLGSLLSTETTFNTLFLVFFVAGLLLLSLCFVFSEKRVWKQYYYSVDVIYHLISRKYTSREIHN